LETKLSTELTRKKKMNYKYLPLQWQSNDGDYFQEALPLMNGGSNLVEEDVRVKK